MDSQLSLPHGTNKKCKRITKNKLMSMISPVLFYYHEGSPMSKQEKLRWKGFVEKVGFCVSANSLTAETRLV